MNPYGPSGFQNLSSNFEFNAENPNFSANSSISKPRMSKTRKYLNSKSKGGLEIKKNDVGSNPFRPVSENVIRVGEESSSFDGDGFSTSNKGRHLKMKVSSKVEKVGNELIDEIRKLRIVNQSNDGQFSNVDNRLPSELSQELNRMNLGGGVSIGGELPNDLRKLNIRDSGEGEGEGEGDGRKFTFSGSVNSDFVFGSGRGNVNSVVDSTLHDNIKKLNISDGNQKKVNVDMSNRAFVFGRTKTVPRAGGAIDAMVFGEMEKLNIGGSSAGIGKDDGRKLNFSEKVPLAGEQERETTAPQAPELNKSSGLSGIPVSSKSPFPPPGGFQYQMPSSDETQKKEGFSFTSKQEGIMLSSVEFKTPEPKSNLFSGSNVNMAFRSKKGTAKVSIPRGRKGKVKVPNPVLVSFANNLSPMETSSQHGSSDSYSPMDVSPYCEIQDDAQSGGEALFTSNDAADEQLVTATERMDINDSSDLKHGGENVDVSEFNVNTDVDRTTVVADSVSAVEDVSFKTAAEDLDKEGQNEVESKYKVEDSDQTQYFSASSSISSGISSFKFAASSSSHGQASVSMLHHRKKNRMKAGPDLYIPPRINTLSDATSSLQFSPLSQVSVLPSPVGQNDAVFTTPFKTGVNKNIASSISKTTAVNNLDDAKKGTSSPIAASRGAQEACEKWRLRGNQAYTNGDLKKAEDCYTKGLSCISRNETSRECLRSLVLCYSNRAAARMSIGRMSDALHDCLVAEQIDPNFFRVQLRAANCYLALGKIGNASRYFKKLLQSTDVCVERKIILEASDGLQKAQKVSECVDRFSLNLRQGTFPEIESALEIIAEALVICPFSEKLLESKAEALFMLRRYEEVIQLCEETLEAAEKNVSVSGPKELLSNTDAELESYSICTWRFGFTFKSNFYLGKLEEALEFLEKQEKWSSMVAKCGNETPESLIPQLSTVHELVRHKSAGNGAFQQEKYTEAVEHYSAALSLNVESRPFAAVCFGNRAAAYQSLGQITDAVADCSLAIALDESYVKAISRRAALFEMIRDYDQAARDLERLVSLLTKQAEEKGPNPTGSISDLRLARQRLYQMEEQAKREIPLNFYLILGVEPSVSSIDLRKAYRKAALKHHPDKAGQSLARSECGDDGLWKEITEEVYKDTDKLFKMIGEAYAVLSDPTKRSQYDIEEEMRNGTKKTGNMSRTANDASVYTEERGGVGRQRREGWRSSANPYSRGFEPSRPGRYY